MTKTVKPPLDLQRFLNRRVMLFGAVAATIGVVASWVYNSRRPRADVARAQPKKKRLGPEELAKPGPLPDLVIGRADAPVTIVEYADLSCPACATFHSKVLPAIKEKYIDKGHVRLVFREFPTNAHSMFATMTMRCVQPDKAMPLISALFTRQGDWREAKTIDELRGKLFALGQQVGLTRQAFNDCVPANTDVKKFSAAQQKLLQDISTAAERAHEGFGVKQTPTFFVNGKKLGGATAEDFEKAIDPLLSKG